MGDGEISGTKDIHSNEDIKRIAEFGLGRPHHLEHYPVRQTDVDNMRSRRHCSTGSTYLRGSDRRQSEIIHDLWRNRALRRPCVIDRFVFLPLKRRITLLKLEWWEYLNICTKNRCLLLIPNRETLRGLRGWSQSSH